MESYVKIECETKIRGPYDKDYSLAIESIKKKYDTLIFWGETGIYNTYFDTPDLLLLKHNHRFRKKRRVGKNSNKYHFKHQLDIKDNIVINREVRLNTGGQALDLANPFHQRMPVLSDLRSFFRRNAGRSVDSVMEEFSPNVCIHSKRAFYAILMQEKYANLAVVVDRVECSKSRCGNGNAEFAFSELEIELWVGNSYPGMLDVLNDMQSILIRAGYESTYESKYGYALRMLYNI